MRRVKFETSFIGVHDTEDSEILEFDDNTTDEEIQEHFTDWLMEHLDGGWEEIY